MPADTPQALPRTQPELTRWEAEALLFALDDADRLFMHALGEQLLRFWQRIHHALCYRDGANGFRGTPEERSLVLSPEEEQQLLQVFDADFLAALPPDVRTSVHGVLARCRQVAP
jgi:hypothetical protein